MANAVRVVWAVAVDGTVRDDDAIAHCFSEADAVALARELNASRPSPPIVTWRSLVINGRVH